VAAFRATFPRPATAAPPSSQTKMAQTHGPSPFPCCGCDRSKAKAEEETLKALYNPQIDTMRAQIKRAEERIWKGPINELLVEAKDARFKAANELEWEMQEKIASVWNSLDGRWG